MIWEVETVGGKGKGGYIKGKGMGKPGAIWNNLEEKELRKAIRDTASGILFFSV